jgi:hypothetical protein
MSEDAGAVEPGVSPNEAISVPEPDLPAPLPTVAPVEHVRALLDRLGALTSDIERVEVIRDELHALRTLAKYLTRWRSFYCIRMWLADVPTHVIAKAAGVADTYVSKRARENGLAPRRNDRRRDG